MQLRTIARASGIGAIVISGLGATFGVANAAIPPGDAKAGKLVFAKCAVCHSINAGENRLGPSLAGVVGRKAAAIANYAYSPALKSSGVTWTVPELDTYLANPRTKIPGAKMFFVGLPKAEDRANVIAYLAKPQ